MRLFIAAFLVVSSFTANAFTTDKYKCTSDAGWKRYELTIKRINLDDQTAVPYVTYKKESKLISGIATVTNDGETESLSLSGINLISFTAGKVSNNCELQ